MITNESINSLIRMSLHLYLIAIFDNSKYIILLKIFCFKLKVNRLILINIIEINYT